MPDFENFWNPYIAFQNLRRINMFCSNRTAGKTYGTGYWIVKEFFLKGRQVGIICRHTYELGHVAGGIFDEVMSREFPDYMLEEVPVGQNLYSNIYIKLKRPADLDKKEEFDDEKTCIGQVMPLNKSGKLKNYSSAFTKQELWLMDEFIPMSETDYVPDEFNKWIRLYMSCCRGGGKQVRFLPVIMLSNLITIHNPYFEGFGVTKNLQANTRKLKIGDDIQLNVFRNPHSSEAMMKVDLFRRLSETNEEVKNSIGVDNESGNLWLLDNDKLIGKPDDWGRSWYMCTLADDNERYGVRYYPEVARYFVDTVFDKDSPYVYNIGEADMVKNLKGTPTMKQLREAFLDGIVWFRNGSLKKLMLDIL